MLGKPTDHAIFSSPDWMLVGFDPDRYVFTFVKTSRARLKDAIFHDGRTPISLDDELVVVPVQNALDWQFDLGILHTPHRVIAHISFCGSTLLARTLDIDGRVMSFREPQVFVDLANAKAMCHRVSMESTQWSMITRFVLNQFQRAWRTKEVSIIKLSNWANNLLFDWSQLSEPLRLVVVHMDLESYIIANLRGGRRRLEYSLNLLNHLTTASGKHRSVVAQVEASKADPFQQVLRHLATCYDLQQVLLFNAAQKMDRPQHVQWMTKSEIVDTPTVSVSRAARVFGLELDQETIEKAIARSLTNHAKSQWRDQFRISAETTANDQISKQYGDQIVAARRWHDQMFPG